MKICLIIGSRLEKLAGLEKHFLELSFGLSNFFDITVIAHVSYRKSFLNSNIKFIELNLNASRYNVLVYLKLYKILKAQKFDIVHAQANKATYLLSKIKKFIKYSKFIGTIHNKKNNTRSFEKMDLVIGVSESVLSQINNKKTVIYNGIDVEKIDNLKFLNLREKFQINNDYPIAVSVGRLVEAKGFDLLIDAIKNININLLILGSGRDYMKLNELIKKFSIESKVILLGFRDDALEIMKNSDFVIVSSRREGFSYVFAEALIMNKDLISTNVADIKKFIPSDYLIKDKNALSIKEKIEFFIDNKRNLDMSFYFNNARKIFSIENMIDSTRNEYLKLKEEIV